MIRSNDGPLSRGGAKVREQLLEAAGEVFAEKGLQGATSRDICIRAGVNLAAVNYHFGGFEALYVATLKEAHRRADLIEPHAVEGFENMSPKNKLRSIIRNLVARLAQSTAGSWEMHLVSREMVIPTFAQAEFVATSIEPRRALLRSIIAEYIGRHIDDPVVARCLFTVVAPSVMLSVVNRSAIAALLPDISEQGCGVTALVDHVERFVFAGLNAVRHNVKNVQSAATKPTESADRVFDAR